MKTLNDLKSTFNSDPRLESQTGSAINGTKIQNITIQLFEVADALSSNNKPYKQLIVHYIYDNQIQIKTLPLKTDEGLLIYHALKSGKNQRNYQLTLLKGPKYWFWASLKPMEV